MIIADRSLLTQSDRLATINCRTAKGLLDHLIGWSDVLVHDKMMSVSWEHIVMTRARMSPDRRHVLAGAAATAASLAHLPSCEPRAVC